jgi:hypothetical protein
MNARWLCLAGLLALSACSLPAPTSAPAPTATHNEIIELATPNATAQSTASFNSGALDKDLARSHYSLDVSLDYASHRIQVAQQILYLNQSEETLNALVLALEGHRVGGLFELQSLRVGGVDFGTAEISGDRLAFSLPEPLAPGSVLPIELSWSLTLPARAAPLGYSARQAHFVDWYPFVPPRQDGAWLLPAAGAAGEHLAYESVDFLARISVEDEEAIVVAAPGQLTPGHYELIQARRFSWSASPDYVRTEGEQDGIPITVYADPQYSQAAAAALQAAQRAQEIYSALYGPYPHPALSFVAADFLDGMESDGFFFLDTTYFAGYAGDPISFLLMLTAHEVAHNWWYGQVGNNPAAEPWLDEALAIYSEVLYYESLDPALVERWWAFRVEQWDPQGAVNSRIYEHAGFTPYVHAVYLRGAQFIQDLRALIGDEAFFAFLRDYADTYAGQIVTSDDFFGLLAEHTDADIQPLLDEYFAEP